MDSLHFDAEQHRYTLGGRVLPSVTQIITDGGLVDYSRIPQAVLEHAKQQGKAIHSMVEMDSQGTLDVAGLPEWMGPVYKAWCAFKDASGFAPILNEYRASHPSLGYAGTLDLLCELPKLKGWKHAALLDVKRSLFAGPAIGIQTAAYGMLVESDRGMPRVGRRGALRLGADGKFALEPYDDASDMTTFLALLTIRRFKERHNLLKD